MNKRSLTKKNGRRIQCIWAVLVLTISLLTVPAMAADDPLSIVNNLSDFIFSIIRALGIIILGWGVVQVGMSIQSHDASQRTQGFLCLFGGLLTPSAWHEPCKRKWGIVSHRETQFPKGGAALSAITGSLIFWRTRFPGGTTNWPRYGPF